MNLLPVYRISVWVPPAQMQRVLDGICAVDDLRIGEYDRVAWISATGIEQFRPLAGATPSLGDIGALESGESVRIEFCIPRDAARLQRVIDEGIRPHHPWEIPAIFVDESLLPLP
jgi:hypothetical protein